MIELRPAELDRDGFAPFGDVIETEGARCLTINEGTTERFHDLASVEIGADREGRTLMSIFRATPRKLPLELRMMECHPIGSQAFVPLSPRPFLIVVAPPGPGLAPESIRAFVSDPGQGVNYAPGVWHHPLLALQQISDFLVVDRGGPGENLIERDLESGTVLVLPPGNQ